MAAALNRLWKGAHEVGTTSGWRVTLSAPGPLGAGTDIGGLRDAEIGVIDIESKRLRARGAGHLAYRRGMRCRNGAQESKQKYSTADVEESCGSSLLERGV